MGVQRLNINKIDTRAADVESALTELRERLSPRGDVVSERGQRLTIEVFGESLSPQQVVEKICGDVRDKGITVVLDYSKKLDRAELTSDSIRVSADDIAEAHKQADDSFLETVRRIRDNVSRIPNGDSSQGCGSRTCRWRKSSVNDMCRLSELEFAFQVAQQLIRQRF